jgi:hypothetical protein
MVANLSLGASQRSNQFAFLLTFLCEKKSKPMMIGTNTTVTDTAKGSRLFKNELLFIHPPPKNSFE